jgi:hypothetical protein
MDQIEREPHQLLTKCRGMLDGISMWACLQVSPARTFQRTIHFPARLRSGCRVRASEVQYSCSVDCCRISANRAGRPIDLKPELLVDDSSMHSPGVHLADIMGASGIA